MKHLLNLLAAVAMLAWGTSLVRMSVMRVFGGNLRFILARGVKNRMTALISGIAVTALVQSSTATALMTSSFVGQGLLTLMEALAVMRGADVGTALMSVLFSLDLTWLSPLLILSGVLLLGFRRESRAGETGQVLVGLGLMLLALHLVVAATEPLLTSPALRAILVSVNDDAMLQITVGAVLAVIAYSSLAIVLLISTIAASGLVPIDAALGLVLGANLGSGILAVLSTARSNVDVRQVTVGNFLFKAVGVTLVAPFIGLWLKYVQPHLPDTAHGVVLFHLSFNILVSVGFIGLIDRVARAVQRLIPKASTPVHDNHLPTLDPSVLATPSLAISRAAREALHQVDLVESMLLGLLEVIRHDDLQLAERLRKMDDAVDRSYSAIKHYLTKISRRELDEVEDRRWTDIIGLSINMEQIGDIVEKMLIDVEKKKIRKARKFSDAGLAEISELHGRLIENLRLSICLFLDGNLHTAQELLREKTRFRDIERAYAAAHLSRLADRTVQSIETSSLHIDLMSDLRRINSHICSIAYPILQSTAVLKPKHLQTTNKLDAAPNGMRAATPDA